jgi:hypothetical protein
MAAPEMPIAVDADVADALEHLGAHLVATPDGIALHIDDEVFFPLRPLPKRGSPESAELAAELRAIRARGDDWLTEFRRAYWIAAAHA